MACRVLRCGRCGAANAVGDCDVCGRRFIISAGRAAGGVREFDDRPLGECPPVEVGACDSCDASERGECTMQAASRRRLQRTCVACHAELLSDHGP